MKLQCKTCRGSSLYVIILVLVLIFTVFLTPTTVSSTEVTEVVKIEDIPKSQAPQHSTLSKNIANVIFKIETGDTLDCSVTGLSGERGCYQFMSSTWNAYSKEVYGEILPITEEREHFVVQQKVKKWLDQGKTARQIFLIWNQGNSGECVRGINRHSVPYDSCAYAEKALILLGKVIPSE